MSRKPMSQRTRNATIEPAARASQAGASTSRDSGSASAQPRFIIKRIRGAFFPAAEAGDESVAKRVYRAIEDFHENDGPTPTIGKWYRAVSHMPALSELCEELDFLADCNFSFVGADGHRVTPHPEALRRVMLVRFLAGVVDSEGWFPARWYESLYGIPGPRLRQWVVRKKLTNRKRPSKNGAIEVVYPFAGVKALAPDVIFDFAPPGQRDKA